MEEKKEYLNEAKYQKANKKLFFVGIGIIIFGIVIALIMIVPKIINGSSNSKEELQKQLDQLKPGLEKRYADLKEKGVTESWDYKDGERYEMHLIDLALDPTLSKCEYSSSYSDNDITREYCSIKAKLYDSHSSISSVKSMFTIVPAIMVLIPCLAIGGMLILISKRRSIMAYTVQQTMPVAQEGIEKMAPSIGKVGASIAKEMAPMYKEVAKEVTKGIREGMNESDKKE